MIIKPTCKFLVAATATVLFALAIPGAEINRTERGRSSGRQFKTGVKQVSTKRTATNHPQREGTAVGRAAQRSSKPPAAAKWEISEMDGSRNTAIGHPTSSPATKTKGAKRFGTGPASAGQRSLHGGGHVTAEALKPYPWATFPRDRQQRTVSSPGETKKARIQPGSSPRKTGWTDDNGAPGTLSLNFRERR